MPTPLISIRQGAAALSSRRISRAIAAPAVISVETQPMPCRSLPLLANGEQRTWFRTAAMKSALKQQVPPDPKAFICYIGPDIRLSGPRIFLDQMPIYLKFVECRLAPGINVEILCRDLVIVDSWVFWSEQDWLEFGEMDSRIGWRCLIIGRHV